MSLPPFPADSAGGLPAATPEERGRSAALAGLIHGEIEAHAGAIPFTRYMELALYAPGLGYYTGGKPKFGASGDFVTAPELGSVFAHCLARQCAQVLAITGGDLLEVGAGHGSLAADLLAELDRLGQLPERYWILELSHELRAAQKDTIRQRSAHLADRVRWLEELPAGDFTGMIVANELLDALPVDRFRMQAGRVSQLAVGHESDRFVWREMPAGVDLSDRIQPLGLAPGYESEVGFVAEAWVRSAADALSRGVILLIDYGFPRAEFYHPDRRNGTLMCHYRHRAHHDPLLHVGLQDITAHVDFTAIAEAGASAGLDLLGYTGQAMFLLGCGLDEVVAARIAGDVRGRLAVAGETKRLTLPQEMGELFKVIAFGRRMNSTLRGFSVQDRRGALVPR